MRQTTQNENTVANIFKRVKKCLKKYFQNSPKGFVIQVVGYDK